MVRTTAIDRLHEFGEAGFTVRIDTEPELVGTDMSAIWQLVSAGFADLDKAALFRQSLTQEELSHDFESSSVAKIVVKDAQERLAGFGTIHHDPEKIVWAHEGQLRQAFKDQVQNDTFSYIAEIVIGSEWRRSHAARTLFRGIGHYLISRAGGPNHVHAGFDFADHNAALPRMIDKACAPMALSTVRLGRHLWYSIDDAPQTGVSDGAAFNIEDDTSLPFPNMGDYGFSDVAAIMPEVKRLRPTDESLSPRLQAQAMGREVCLVSGLSCLDQPDTSVLSLEALNDIAQELQDGLVIVGLPADKAHLAHRLSKCLSSYGRVVVPSLADVQTYAKVVGASS